MQIRVNGVPRQVAASTTLAALVAELGHQPGQVAVERNREIVPRATYEEVELADGDELEVVTFVGGG